MSIRAAAKSFTQFVTFRFHDGSWQQEPIEPFCGAPFSTESLDAQIAEWLDETGVQIVSTAAPAVSQLLIDGNPSLLVVIIGIAVVYMQPIDAEPNGPPTGA